MPAGKAGVVAGAVWIERLPHAVNIRSLRQWTKPGTRRLAVDEIKELRETLRFAFSRYRIDCRRLQQTPTERRQTIRKIGTAAQRFAKTPNWSWADKLLFNLDTDRSADTIIRRHLGVAGKDWLLFKKGLRDVVAVSAPPNKYLPTVRQLANIDLNALAPLGGRWRDPGLPGLVATLVPIWKRVTGRTAGLVSVGKDCETKKCLFANWLGEMLGKIGIRPPPVGRVVDIVRAEN
jgi:hypothetical protein